MEQGKASRKGCQQLSHRDFYFVLDTDAEGVRQRSLYKTFRENSAIFLDLLPHCVRTSYATVVVWSSPLSESPFTPLVTYPHSARSSISHKFHWMNIGTGPMYATETESSKPVRAAAIAIARSLLCNGQCSVFFSAILSTNQGEAETAYV